MSLKLALLVGGYAASPWLFAKLRDRLVDVDLVIEVFRPDIHTYVTRMSALIDNVTDSVSFSNKAVADGAVSYYLKNVVTSRVAQLTYGVPCSRPYYPFIPEHAARSAQVYVKPSGRLSIPELSVLSLQG